MTDGQRELLACYHKLRVAFDIICGARIHTRKQTVFSDTPILYQWDQRISDLNYKLLQVCDEMVLSMIPVNFDVKLPDEKKESV